MLSIRVVMLVILIVFAIPAHADSYAFYNLGDANEINIDGIDSIGNVLVETHYCPSLSCWEIFTNGVLVSQYDEMPQFNFDNGTPCDPSPFSVRGTCNNGYEAYWGYFEPLVPGSIGIFTGPTMASLLSVGSGDVIDVNSEGDIAVTDGRDEIQWEAIDLTSRSQSDNLDLLVSRETPEPSSWTLLASGILALAGTVRRRFMHL